MCDVCWEFMLLLSSYSGDINVNAAMLSEIDKMVQLIESPVFVCECLLYREWGEFVFSVVVVVVVVVVVIFRSAFADVGA